MSDREAQRRLETSGAYVIVLLVVLSVVPTALNRFPLVYFDSAAYISAWTTGDHVHYPAFYPLFVWLASRAATLYFTVVAQAALAIYVLWVFFKAVIDPARGWILPAALIALVLLLTQLPWLINWLMPDLFCGLGAVCIMACVFFTEALHLRDKVCLLCIAAFSAVVATANILVLVPFALVCIALRWLLWRETARPRLVAPALLFAAAVIGASISANVGFNGRPVINPTWAALAFNKLLDAGIAQRYLHTNCPNTALKVCDYLNDIDEIHEPSGFLWRGLADRVDAWRDPAGDFGGAVLAITRAEFPAVVRLALGDIAALFFAPSLGYGEFAAYSKETGIYYNVAALYPQYLPYFVAAPQQAGAVQKWLPARYYRLSTYLSYGLIVLLTIVFAVRSDRVGASLGLAAIAFVILGLTVHGALATPDARYHVKVSWTVWAVAIACIYRWRTAGRSVGSAAGQPTTFRSDRTTVDAPSQSPVLAIDDRSRSKEDSSLAVRGQDGTASSRYRNSYDFVRFCAAAAVLFSHHFSLVGLPSPPVPGFREDLGAVALETFFCLSGFLICRSLQANSGWPEFLASRILRIFPNLAVTLALTSIVTLLWYRNYANLWDHAHYIVKNLAMFTQGVQYLIPGVFQDALEKAVNGSLWSLPGELWLYVLLFVLFVLTGRRSTIAIPLSALAMTIVWAALPRTGHVWLDPIPHDFDALLFSRLGSFFLSGATLACFWHYIEGRGLILGTAGLLAVVFIHVLMLPTDTILSSLALASVIIGFGSTRAMAWFSRGGDASYGMYILAWPVQQFSLLLIGSFWTSLFVALLVTAALGYATWHTFERRALSYRGRLAAGIRKIFFLSDANDDRRHRLAVASAEYREDKGL